MPTVLILFGLKFRIYTAEHQPPHCHVTSQDGQAKFEIKDEVILMENRGLKPKDLSLAKAVLEENLELIQEQWKNIGFAPRKDNVKIYERFRNACNNFYKQKSLFFKTLKEDFANNLKNITFATEMVPWPSG